MISIIVCTRNRAKSLRPTLLSISRVTIPPEWKVDLVVVDNGSVDDTEAVVRETHLNGLNARYVFEPKVGLSNARNTGLKETCGETILFTDDDVRVPADWVDTMCRPIVDGIADAVQGGVKVAPQLERPWLTGALRIWVAAVEDLTHPPEGLVGANMAFSRKAFEIVGGFDSRLGAGAGGFFEDTVFGWNLKRAQQRLLYIPSVAVEHHFSSDRLAVPAYLSIAKKMAISRAVVMRTIHSNTSRPTIVDLLVEIPGLIFRFFTQAFRYLIYRAPDPGFMVRYYRVCLWCALRKNLP